MNENNLEYLKKTLEGLGFGAKLNGLMGDAIRRELPAFSLGIETMRRPVDSKKMDDPRTDRLAFTLNFNRSKQSDMYFLNDYTVLLNKKGEFKAVAQTLSLERDHRITAYQAHRLLSGMSLEKEVYLREKAAPGQEPVRAQEKTPLWFSINLDVTDAFGNHPLRTFRPEYGYDLGEALAKYPLKGLNTPDKLGEAMKALRNGNYVDATLTLGRKNVPVSIAANPQMKTIDIYDKDMVEIRNETIFPEKAKSKGQEQQVANKETAKRDNGQHGKAQPWEQEPEVDTGPKRGR